MNKRFYHWIRLQRRYRSTQKKWAETNDTRLYQKLDRIGRRLQRLNRQWKLGISTAALTAWLAFMPAGELQAQVSADVASLPGIKLSGEAAFDNLGSSVSAVGDVNGDGIDDVVIGAPFADPNGNDSGTMYVVFGSATGFSSPPELSTLDGTNGFKLFGEATFDQSGRSVSAAGDVNGDGIDDLLIGAPYADPNGNNGAGTTYVVFGKNVSEVGAFTAEIELASLDGTNGFKILGEAANDNAGRIVNAVGDVNGDGISDILISAPNSDLNGNNAGTTYVVFGKNVSEAGAFAAELELSGLDGTNGFKIFGEAANDKSGESASGAGDVNGDGIDDLLIGSKYAYSNGNYYAGTTYVVFGKNTSEEGAFAAEVLLSSLDGTNGFKIFGESAYDNSGRSVSAAGDVNSDGIDDILIGAPNAKDYSGASYVVFGKNVSQVGAFTSEVELSSLDGTNGFSIIGADYGYFGRSVSAAGDINGDGIDDVLIGAPYASPVGISTGAVYVVFGSDTGFEENVLLSNLDGTNGFELFGEDASDNIGFAISAAGDVNGDGSDDLLIGADDNGPNGSVYIIFGGDALAAPVLSISLADTRAIEGDAFTYTIPSTAFVDLFGDELTLSATLEDGSPLPGWLSFDASTGTLSGTPGSEDLGISTIRITATDGDNLSVSDVFELTVFNRFFEPFPTLSLLTSDEGFKILGEADFDNSGNSVSTIGDVNGDGIDDLLIGAPFSDLNGTSSGTTYVVFGKDVSVDGAFAAEIQLSGLDGTNGFKIIGEAASDLSGRSVSAAGDVNGDGIDDLLIGAVGSDTNGNSSGTTYVVFGRDVSVDGAFAAEIQLSGLDGTNGFKMLGEASLDQSGSSVSAAGDVNGDGIGDMLIGAPASDPNGSGSGTTYVVFGKNVSVDGAFAAEIQLSGLDGTNGFKIIGEASFDQSGNSVSGAGDVDGDGIDDLLIGASLSDPNGFSSGTTYVIFGKDVLVEGAFAASIQLSGLDGTNGFKIIGETGGDSSGRSVSAAGDVNGDGIGDVLIGAPTSDPNGSNSGTTYVVFGKNVSVDGTFTAEVELSGLDGTNGFKIFGETDDDNSGHSVSSAGDVNGDGIDDLFIGAYSVDLDNRNPNAGATYVVFGRDQSKGIFFSEALELSNLDVGLGFKLLGESDNDRLGGSVSSAGDVNSDGIDDVLIGARNSDINASNSGTSYVVFGKEALAPVLPDATLTDAQAVIDNLFNYEIPSGTFFDPEGGSLTFSATQADDSALPAWLTFDPAAGTFSGTPVVADLGEITVKVTAADALGLTVSDEFAITVRGNTPPVLEAVGAQTVRAGIPLSFTATATDTDGDALTFSLDQASIDKGMTIDASTGLFSWTPTASDVGANEVTLTVNDLAASDSETFTITVEPNEVPVLEAIGAQTATAGEVLSFTATATDEEGDALTFRLDQISVAKGMTIDATTGEFTWTPAASDVGENEVTLSVSDAAASDSETFTITVEENESPVLAAIGGKTVTEGEVLSFTATATDAEGDALTFSLDQASVDRGMTINATTGAFSWTPATSDLGTNEVTLSVSDGVTNDSETFIITVEARPLGLEDLGEVIVVYPNPTKGRVTFEGLEGKHRSVVYSQSGALLMDSEITDGSLDISALEAGNYLIIIEKEEKVLFYTRVVKTN